MSERAGSGSTGSNAPTPKVVGAGAGGAIATILVWVLGLAGVEVPPEVAAALATVVAFIGGYIRREPAAT